MKVFGSSLVAAVLLVASSQPGFAAAGLVGSTPAQGSVVAAPRTISLSFAAPMPVSATAASIVMTAMPGMDHHGEMVIRNFTQLWADNNKRLTLSLKKPLYPGDYDVRWESRGADGRRIAGKVTFTVK